VNGTFVVTEKKVSKKLTKPVNAHVPLVCEEMNKMTILSAIFPAIYGAKHGLMLENWENSHEKSECTKELNYLVECYIWTSKCDTIGKKATEPYQTKYPWVGDKTPVSPDMRHWACALFIAESVVALLCLKPTEDNKSLLHNYINCIFKAHADDSSYRDKDYVDDIGKIT